MDVRTADKARELSRKALEEYAEEIFDVPSVAVRIQRAIRAGRSRTRIPQDRPLDLSGTTAAALLVLHLESLGYATSWEEVRRTENVPREGSVETVYCELMVEWFERLFS